MTEEEFKIGDEVACITSSRWIKPGVYTIKKIENQSGEVFFYVEGNNYGHYAHRFRKIKPDYLGAVRAIVEGK